MNNDLSFWRKLILDLTKTPKTDADIAYIYRDYVRPEIPASALWDAEKGAQLNYDPKNEGFDVARQRAILNRGWGINQTAQDMPKWTPTRSYMEQLLNPDKLIVVPKEEMRNIW